MIVDVYASYNHVVERNIKDRTILIVDTLRFTSTAITALANGCKQIIPVEEIEEAQRVAHNMRENVCLRAGERNAEKISGFELGNSPLEFLPNVVGGTVIILTTSNGTRALRKVPDSSKCLLAAFLNISAVAHAACSLGKDVAIICAGTDKRFSTDDILTAGGLISRMRSMLGKAVHMELDDLGQAADFMYQKHKGNLHKALSSSRHYRVLVSKGFESDVLYCLQEDVANIVPVYKDGLITI